MLDEDTVMEAVARRMMGPLLALRDTWSSTGLERFYVRNAAGDWDRVRWGQVSYHHLAYWDDVEMGWLAVPGREVELEEYLQERRGKQDEPVAAL